MRMQVIALGRAIAGWMAVDAARTVEDLGYLGKQRTRPRILVGDTLEGCRGAKLVGRLRLGGDTTRDHQQSERKSDSPPGGGAHVLFLHRT
jgi:hypothetical protein